MNVSRPGHVSDHWFAQWLFPHSVLGKKVFRLICRYVIVWESYCPEYLLYTIFILCSVNLSSNYNLEIMLLERVSKSCNFGNHASGKSVQKLHFGNHALGKRVSKSCISEIMLSQNYVLTLSFGNNVIRKLSKCYSLEIMLPEVVSKCYSLEIKLSWNCPNALFWKSCYSENMFVRYSLEIMLSGNCPNATVWKPCNLESVWKSCNLLLSEHPMSREATYLLTFTAG